MGRGEAESGGRERPATLCASFEALVGALYLDQDLEAVKSAALRPGRAGAAAVRRYRRLQRCQEPPAGVEPKHLPRHPPLPDMAQANGPDHDKQFTVHAVIDGHVWGIGHGRSKQVASMAAAAHALEYAEAHQYDEVIPLPNLLAVETDEAQDDGNGVAAN
jgi:ribonuclease-3